MAYLARVARIVIPSLLVLPLAGACGGQSFSSGGEGASGAADPRGGMSTSGGTSSTGGKTTTGGTSPVAGTHSGGATTAGTGSGGAGPGGEECNAPAVSGNCDAYVPSWHHDPATGICMPFVYGGCGGNANRYASLEDCQKACPGGSPNYDACTQATDCMIAGAGCCGVCDGPDVNPNQLIAYNRKYAGKIAQCDVACGPCPSPQPGTGTYANFVPTCVNQQCAIIDIRETELTACAKPIDCRVRHGNNCCEGCGGDYDLIAVRTDGSFEKYVCGSEPVACPACDPLPSPNVVATCGPQGHCELAVLTPTQ